MEKCREGRKKESDEFTAHRHFPLRRQPQAAEAVERGESLADWLGAVFDAGEVRGENVTLSFWVGKKITPQNAAAFKGDSASIRIVFLSPFLRGTPSACRSDNRRRSDASHATTSAAVVVQILNSLM